MEDAYDHVVIGAGVQGSATAYYLAKEKKRVLLVEQFQLQHENGSSHGRSRVIRRGYKEDCFAQLTAAAYEEWGNIMSEAKREFYVKAGTLFLVERSQVDAFTGPLEKYGAEYRILNPDQIKSEFPLFSYGKDTWGVLDVIGGVIEANKALESLHALFKANGGTVVEDAKVTDIDCGDPLTVRTAVGDFTARSLVICAGPFAKQLCQKTGLDLPLTVQKVPVFYWKEKVPGSHTVANGFPTFIDFSYNDVYGLPSLEYPGYVKICGHDIRLSEDVDKIHRVVSGFVKEHFPGLVPQAAITQHCKYTLTPDEIFILDNHPKFKNIVIGAGFSGTGFKMAPVVGKILADLANGRKPSFELDAFRIARFQ